MRSAVPVGILQGATEVDVAPACQKHDDYESLYMFKFCEMISSSLLKTFF